MIMQTTIYKKTRAFLPAFANSPLGILVFGCLYKPFSRGKYEPGKCYRFSWIVNTSFNSVRADLSK